MVKYVCGPSVVTPIGQRPSAGARILCGGFPTGLTTGQNRAPTGACWRLGDS